MVRTAARLVYVLLLFAPARIQAQREPQAPPADENSYGSKFFDQLRGIFGKFREADLQHAFRTAEPIQCSELVINKGEWRTVAFFNEDRSLGEWCRNNIDEVKSDLAVYRFKGTCTGDRSSIQVATEFPVGESIEAYNSGKINLNQVDVNVNDPVNASFDPQTQAYIFELPFLFLTSHRESGNVYSLIAPDTRAAYATEVTSRWECKAVKSADVTYRFLICRTSTVARNKSVRNRNPELAFGASAFFILSDGKEAQTSVNLSFGDPGHPVERPPEPQPPATPHTRPAIIKERTPASAENWKIPDARSKIVDLRKSEFRLRFSPQTWAGKIGSPEVLSDQKLSSPLSSRQIEGVDYCTWRPEATNLADRLLAEQPDEDVSYSLEFFDKKSRPAASIVIDVKTAGGDPLGTLECVFPRTESVATIAFDRWVSIVGGHLALEVRK